MAESPDELRITEAAQKIAARGSKIIAEQEKADGGKIGLWFGTKHQWPNILAVLSISLVAMIILSIIGAIYRDNLEYFKVIGLSLIPLLTTIIGFLVGQRFPPQKDP